MSYTRRMMMNWTGFCHRCGQRSPVHTMSHFSTELICPACGDLERGHPEYGKAVTAELDALHVGDFTFQGIGWPRPTATQEGDNEPFTF